METNTRQFTKERQIKYRHSAYTMILPVYNEEARVKRVVEYYRPFAKLIVVDNFSTDRTSQILEELGVTVVHYKNPGTTQTPECMRYFFSLVETDYVVFLACSEFIPRPALDLFEKIAFEKSYDIVSCVRESYTCGELIPLWGGRFKGTEARIERFINKHFLDVDKVVIHGHFVPLNRDRLLKLPRDERYVVVHLRDSDSESLIKKSLDYALVEARHREQRDTPITCFKLILLLAKEVLRFLQLPIAKWNRIALREIWARMVMHSITHWIGWELKNQRTMEYSHQQNEHLWQQLVMEQYDRVSEYNKLDE